MKTRALFASAALVLSAAGCTQAVPQSTGLSSFAVTLNSVTLADTSTPAPVVTTCQKKYGGEAKVPLEVRGTPDCNYAITADAIDFDVSVQALDVQGQPMAFDQPISFVVRPGDLFGDYTQRQVLLQNGQGELKVRAKHLSGDVRIWAEDAPPQTIYDGGYPGGDTQDLLPEPPVRTYATGLSPIVSFQPPTLGAIQTPDDGTSRTDPFQNQFVTIGVAGGTSVPVESCPDDPAHDGQPMMLLVSGTDPQGYYVTDVNGCRQKEPVVAHETPEPDGFLPGTYSYIYVYNSSYPDGLYQGDLLWSFSGSVQEFTSSTQLSFDSWSLREDITLLPQDQWNKYEQLAPPIPIKMRTCGVEDVFTPFLNDALCGYSYSNLKMESLESGLVKVSNTRFPNVVRNCDFNADGSVAFFCPTATGWDACFVGEADPDEYQCNIDCTVGLNDDFGKICAEQSSLALYGQYIIEMAPPGPAEAHLDDSVPSRIQTVAVSGTSATVAQAYLPTNELAVWCTTDVKYALGPDAVTASTSSTALAAKTILRPTLTASQTKIAFVTASGGPGTCYVSQNPKTRILVSTLDSIPDLKIDCSETDADPDAAAQCKNLHGATFDVTGFLNQVAPARPRWLIKPRSPDDVCCRPGPGLSCPTPIQACAD